MIRHFLSLKLALLRNAFKIPGSYSGFIVLGYLLACICGLVGFVVLANAGRSLESDLVPFAFSFVWLLWILFPIFGYGIDETLDVSRFALLPLTDRQLISGLLAGALISPGSLATAIALVGFPIGGMFRSTGFGVRALPATLIAWVTCVVTARVVTTAASGLARTRWARDLTAVVTTIVGASGYLAYQLLFRMLDPLFTNSQVTRLAFELGKYLPPGMAAQAVLDLERGNFLLGLLGIVAPLGFLLLLVIVWGPVLRRALTSPIVESRRRRHRRWNFSRYMERVGVSARAGGIAQKELLYEWRQPQRRANVFMGVGFFAAALGYGIYSGIIGTVYGVFLTATPMLLYGLRSVNMIGTDGRATWIDFVAGGDPRDLIRGKGLTLLIWAVCLGVPTMVAAAVIGGRWEHVPVALSVAIGDLLVILAVGNYASVKVPIPVPDNPTNIFGQTSSGQNLAEGFVQLGYIFVQGALSLPVIVVVAIGLLFWWPALVIGSLGSLLYGYWLWRVSVDRSAVLLAGSQPEILAKLAIGESPR